VFCPDCGKPILLRDVIEEKFESPSVQEQVREMQSEGQAVIDNESRTSDGEIRRMDVSAYRKREGAGGKAVRQIVFAEGFPWPEQTLHSENRKVKWQREASCPHPAPHGRLAGRPFGGAQ
jgi:hypothetical protein